MQLINGLNFNNLKCDIYGGIAATNQWPPMIDAENQIIAQADRRILLYYPGGPLSIGTVRGMVRRIPDFE
jgi:hypothetical protein